MEQPQVYNFDGNGGYGYGGWGGIVPGFLGGILGGALFGGGFGGWGGNALLNELKSTKANYDYLISHQDEFKKGSEWCDEQITMRDPVRNAEMQNAKQVEAIKKEFGGIIAEQNAKIDQLTSLLQQALAPKKGKE